MDITFLGAVRETTGSMHLLNFEGKLVLLDCGLYQGRRAETRTRNVNFPFSPDEVNSLVLSHSHIDHCGNIPNLVKQGFKGDIYCTAATRELAGALLRDSAYIQEKDVEYLNKKRERRNEELIEPLYTIEDAEESLHQLNGLAYRRPFHVLRKLRCEFYDAGHILGSALSVLEYTQNGHRRRILFTGDLGREGMPILRNPEIPEGVDTLIIESTYGARLHDDFATVEDELTAVVQKVYERKGKIIVPSFSVGRTQELVYCLKNLLIQKRIPPLPIYVDSPLSVNVTEIFRHHPECYDKDASRMFMSDPDVFGFEQITYIRDVAKSKELNSRQEPCIIISASGMCEAGRILHHLKNNIENPKNLVLIVGFMAHNTLGRRLADRLPEVKIFGETYKRNAQVKIMNEFSAHADQQELIDFTLDLQQKGNLQNIFVVHGEEEQSLMLRDQLKERTGLNVIVPEKGETFSL